MSRTSSSWKSSLSWWKRLWNKLAPCVKQLASPQAVPQHLKDVTSPVLCPLHAAPSPGGQPQLPHHFYTSFVSADPSAVSLGFILHPQDRNSTLRGTKEPWHQDYPEWPEPCSCVHNCLGSTFLFPESWEQCKDPEAHTPSTESSCAAQLLGKKILFLRNCVLAPMISHWISITSAPTEMPQGWKPFHR